MKTTIFKKNGQNKKGVETSKPSNDTKKSIPNFLETIPLMVRNLEEATVIF
jgi:hypothetical protein